MSALLDRIGRKRRVALAVVTRDGLAKALGLPDDIALAEVRMADDRSGGLILILEGVELPLVHPGEVMARVSIVLHAPAQCEVRR